MFFTEGVQRLYFFLQEKHWNSHITKLNTFNTHYLMSVHPQTL